MHRLDVVTILLLLIALVWVGKLWRAERSAAVAPWVTAVPAEAERRAPGLSVISELRIRELLRELAPAPTAEVPPWGPFFAAGGTLLDLAAAARELAKRDAKEICELDPVLRLAHVVTSLARSGADSYRWRIRADLDTAGMKVECEYEGGMAVPILLHEHLLGAKMLSLLPSESRVEVRRAAHDDTHAWVQGTIQLQFL